VAVVSALKKIARQAGLQQIRSALTARRRRNRSERDADAEQQRQRDDIGEVERQPDQHADFQRHRPPPAWNQRQQHTSVTRRNASQSRTLITTSAQMPA
jgi:hypothetical protein